MKYATPELADLRAVRVSPKLAQIGSNLWLFKFSFQYILARRAKMYWKLILKSPRFVGFDANLAKSAIPAQECNPAMQQLIPV